MDEWDALADRTGGLPWARPGWFEAWYAAFGRGTPLVVSHERDGALKAVGAFEHRRGVLRSATNWHSPAWDVVAPGEGDVRALADDVLARRPRRLELAFLEAGSRTGRAFVEAAAAAGYRLLVRTLERSPYVALSGSWTDFMGGRQADFRRELARRRRRLAEEGEVRFELEDGRERLEELLAEGFRVEGSGWKEEEGTAIVSRPETRRFYEEIARWAAERGWLRLAFLRLDGRAIAFELMLEDRGVRSTLKGGYDQSLRRFGPGQLVQEDLLRDAFERGLRECDFLGADEPWKREWTDRVRDRVLIQAFAPTAAGLADWAAFRFGRPAAKRVVARFRA